MGWLTEQGDRYCEGDKPYGNYWMQVPDRPSPQHIWGGGGEGWIIDPAQLVPMFERAIQVYLDEAAKTKGYDGVLSACSYASSISPRFGPEGRAFLRWRDAVWTYCYQALEDVQTGARALPSIDQLLAELPQLTF